MTTDLYRAGRTMNSLPSQILDRCASFKQALRLTNYILTTGFILTLFSCDRLKRKGQEVVDRTQEKVIAVKQKISDKKDRLADKVFPTYYDGKPDTENNKSRFKEHLQVGLTGDVKNIYAYSDFLGIDYKVLIAFTCDQATIDKIIAVKKMQLIITKDDSGLFFSDKFQWWDKDKIELLEPYKVGKDGEYWEYLWYDKKNRTAFYEEFSM